MNKVISKIVVVGTAVTVMVASSITAFAGQRLYEKYNGMAGSCGYLGEAYIWTDQDNGIYDLVGAYVSSVQTADLAVLGYGTPDEDINKFWYSGSQAQTTDVGASVKSNVPIYKNVGTAYISSDDGDEEHSFTLYRQ